MSNWKDKEKEARDAIEAHRFVALDANVLFRANCPNIDVVVFGRTKAVYVQVKSSEVPAGKNCVIVDGSPWTEAQLHQGAPIFNKHGKSGNFEASLVVIVDRQKNGKTSFYIAPPKALEDLVRQRARVHADLPKKDGSRRSIAFRKELSGEALEPWLDAWHLLGEPPNAEN